MRSIRQPGIKSQFITRSQMKSKATEIISGFEMESVENSNLTTGLLRGIIDLCTFIGVQIELQENNDDWWEKHQKQCGGTFHKILSKSDCKNKYHSVQLIIALSP